VGPFFSIGLSRGFVGEVAGPGVEGERLTVRGRILDGRGEGVPDAVVETWQADARGRFDNPRFRGFGRVPTDATGAFELSTIRPGRVADSAGGEQAPHLAVVLFMRGLLLHLFTRVYFSDDPGLAEDVVLAAVPSARRTTLVARRLAGDEAVYEWNAILQGPDETVFFDY
jgi:protocatechuate 3,4-dioxygenase alpha subunit